MNGKYKTIQIVNRMLHSNIETIAYNMIFNLLKYTNRLKIMMVSIFRLLQVSGRSCLFHSCNFFAFRSVAMSLRPKWSLLRRIVSEMLPIRF